MSSLLSPSQVREIAQRYGIRPTRSLGQNFMVDANAIRRVVRLAQIAPDEQVVEVGAGLGTLTVALSAAASAVTAVEIDRKLIPALREAVSGLSNVKIVEGDALRVDFSALTEGRRHRVVSNLPYNIATPLVAGLLEKAPEIYDLSLVVQREAGERFVAPPGSKTYGAISVMVAYYCSGQVLGKVPPTVFWPQPNVESVVVRLTRRPPLVDVDPRALKTVVRAAFSQRRKTIRNTLASGLGLSFAEAESVISAAGVEPGRRAEMLSLEQFAALTQTLAARDLLATREIAEAPHPIDSF